jgi:hypothetical protein
MQDHIAYRSIDTIEDTLLTSLHCDLILFLSVLPLQGITPSQLSTYEAELRLPTGQSVVVPPAMEISGVMYSPDCGVALEWRNEPTVKVERFWTAGRWIGIASAVICAGQIWCVVKEMAERGSPSVRTLFRVFQIMSNGRV